MDEGAAAVVVGVDGGGAGAAVVVGVGVAVVAVACGGGLDRGDLKRQQKLTPKIEVILNFLIFTRIC